MRDTEVTAMTKSLSKCLFRYFDKPERIKALHAARNSVEPKELATIFSEIWMNSESIFANHEEISDILALLRSAGTTKHMMTKSEQRTFKKLQAKGKVRLYRGCAENNFFGYSWTTDYDRAVFFAKRNALDGYPVVLTADISSEHLVAYLEGRNESEVIVDISSLAAWQEVHDSQAEDLGPIKVSPASKMYWMVQTKMRNADTDDLFLRMNIAQMKKSGKAFSMIEGMFNDPISDLEAFDFEPFTSRANEFRAKRAKAVEFWNDPENDAMFNAI